MSSGMALLARRAPKIAARRFCAAASSGTVRDAVNRLAADQPAAVPLDLKAKFELLTACEEEFGMRMPHTALNEVQTIDDAARWWAAKIAMVAEAQEKDAQHFTKAQLPNLNFFGKGQQTGLKTWIATYKNSEAVAGDEELEDEVEWEEETESR